MNKKHFMFVMDNALVLEKGVMVYVSVPDLPLPEIIYNPHGNLYSKIQYYDKAYDDEMKLKANEDIFIIDADVSGI